MRFRVPKVEDLASSEVSAFPEEDEDPNQPRAGWQSRAARKVEASGFARLESALTDPQKTSHLVSAPFIFLRRLRPH